MQGWRLAWWRSTEKKEASQLLEWIGRHQYSDQSSLCSFHRSGDGGRGGPNGQVVSIKRAADGKRQRSKEIVAEKRERYRAKNGSLRNTSTDSKGATFVILKTTQARLSERIDRAQRAKQEERPAEVSLWKGRDARQSRKLSGSRL